MPVLRNSRGLKTIIHRCIPLFRGLKTIIHRCFAVFRGLKTIIHRCFAVFRGLKAIFHRCTPVFRGLKSIFHRCIPVFRGLKAIIHRCFAKLSHKMRQLFGVLQRSHSLLSFSSSYACFVLFNLACQHISKLLSGATYSCHCPY